jgi:hypothetical protein
MVTAYDNITHIDLALNRWAWRPLGVDMGLLRMEGPPPPGDGDRVVRSLDAERWTALSVVKADRPITLYESREVYRGPVAPLVRLMYGSALQEGFDAMAKALKQTVEDAFTNKAEKLVVHTV